MFRSLLRDKVILSLIFLAVFIKILSLNKLWVEHYYTYGFYPWFSRLLRILFGWTPLSIGDVLYAMAFFYLLAKAFKFIKLLKNRQVKEYLSWVLVKKLVRLVLWIYLVFNVFWGLNYNRRGIAGQLHLKVEPYTLQDLNTVTSVLLQRLNTYADQVDSARRSKLDKNKMLFRGGVEAYEEVHKQMPFLYYDHPSIKASLFSRIGHFFGFTGYYNPFTGEAQVKTSVPSFLKPFIVAHEIGHQLGYAKENEANFAGYFACRSSKNPEFRYSVYYEMYRYAVSELRRKDSALARVYKFQLHPQVQRDNLALINYFLESDNPMEPVVSSLYDEYLRWNSQPKGKMTYNEVVAWLIAYQKRFGIQSI